MSSMRSGLHVKSSRTFRRRRIRAALAVGLGVIAVWLAVSLGGALTNPTYGSSRRPLRRMGPRARRGRVVNWAENEWYSHHPPKWAAAARRSDQNPAVAPGRRHGRPGAPHSAGPDRALRQPGHPRGGPVVAGRSLGRGHPRRLQTTLRPDTVHTSYVVGVAWMDTKLLQATLYSGSQIPGGGPYTSTAPIGPAAADSLVAAFNAGFLMSNAEGGYYTDGKTVFPLRDRGRSFVVYADGTATVGQWGRDVSMTPTLSRCARTSTCWWTTDSRCPASNAADTTQWGFTLGDPVYVWRSGLA